MPFALLADEVLTPEGWRADVAVVVDGERIAAVVAADDPAIRARDRVHLAGLRLAPGFIDVQVNGGGGVLFNDAPTPEGIAAIGAAHRRFGTTGFLPTLISDDLEVIARAMRAVDEAIVAGVPGVLGIHVEGPFLNPDRKGIHDPAKFRRLDEPAFELLTSLRHGATVATLAPELTTPAMIGRLAQAGVRVSAGHTDATYRQTRAALDAGLSGFTHLFNAMSPLTSREPGAVGAALEDQHAWCGLIVDGHHVDPAVLRLALRCRPHDRFMLVTDAMPSVGSREKTFALQGRTITVEAGVCRDEAGTLAGADLDMMTAVRNAHRTLGLRLGDALHMASAAPARFLGLPRRGSIAEGCAADLVAVSDDLRVAHTWIAGAMD